MTVVQHPHGISPSVNSEGLYFSGSSKFEIVSLSEARDSDMSNRSNGLLFFSFINLNLDISIINPPSDNKLTLIIPDQHTI